MVEELINPEIIQYSDQTTRRIHTLSEVSAKKASVVAGYPIDEDEIIRYTYTNDAHITQRPGVYENERKVARLKAPSENILQCGFFHYNPDSLDLLTPSLKLVHLELAEHELLKFLMVNPNRVMTSIMLEQLSQQRVVSADSDFRFRIEREFSRTANRLRELINDPRRLYIEDVPDIGIRFRLLAEHPSYYNYYKQLLSQVAPTIYPS